MKNFKVLAVVAIAVMVGVGVSANDKNVVESFDVETSVSSTSSDLKVYHLKSDELNLKYTVEVEHFDLERQGERTSFAARLDQIRLFQLASTRKYHIFPNQTFSIVQPCLGSVCQDHFGPVPVERNFLSDCDSFR